jgi:hypothetical protein
MTRMSEKRDQLSTTARGVSQLTIDAVEQATKLVEMMHSNISAAAPPLGKGTNGRTRGLTGFVYGSIRMANRISGSALDLALGQLEGRVGQALPQPRTDALMSVVNGVVGDHLVATANPLAIDMHVRSRGRALTLKRESLARAVPEAGGKILLAVHGSCMNDRQWLRKDWDHGVALARDLDYTNVYLRYNSGRHISTNGREFAELLEELINAWPVPVGELSILAHSMGGLVTRSACHYASSCASSCASSHTASPLGNPASARGLGVLRHVIFLGTPHHGAPLARGGNALQNVLGFSPYTAALAKLTSVRSAGITDLRYGNLLDEDWQGADRFESTRDGRNSVPLAMGVQCYAIAATLGQNDGDLEGRMLGDGLVPVASALGHHRDATRALELPEAHQSIHYGRNHWDLLSDRDIYQRIRNWLK